MPRAFWERPVKVLKSPAGAFAEDILLYHTEVPVLSVVAGRICGGVEKRKARRPSLTENSLFSFSFFAFSNEKGSETNQSIIGRVGCHELELLLLG